MKERIRKRSYPAKQPDELYRIDADGEKLHGRYDDMGYFIVDESDRRAGINDRDGYLIDERGLRIVDDVIRDRMRIRNQMFPQEDESYGVDCNGKKLGGKYSRNGQFLVDVRDRNPATCDEDGYLLDANGEKYRNLEMKERKRQRKFLRHQRFMKPQEDEFYAYDGNGERVNGRYDANGWLLVDPSERGPGKTDKDGYLVDYTGERLFSNLMQERLTKRKDTRAKQKAGKVPQDELVAVVNGVRIPGKYDKNGNFAVAESHKNAVRVDA